MTAPVSGSRFLSRPPLSRRRRSAVVMIGAALVSAALSFTGWRASPAAASSSLESYELGAGGRGYQVFNDDPANGKQEGDVPEASVLLQTGGRGYGLASVAWPGPLAANAGSLILVLNPSAPSQVNSLNYPLRAEARTPQNPPTTTYDKVPGTTLTATAKADLVQSDASVQSSSGDPGTFGPTHVHSLTTLTDGTGVSEATSLVEDVAVAAGVVKIKSVASAASATTDGKAADGTSSTVVSGLTIAGQPATVDESGLHIGSQNQPANAVVNQIAQQALSQSGIGIVLSAPTKEIAGAMATVTAGSLIITWKQKGSTLGVVLGGARAAVTGVAGSSDTVASTPAAGSGTTAPGGGTTGGTTAAPAAGSGTSVGSGATAAVATSAAPSSFAGVVTPLANAPAPVSGNVGSGTTPVIAASPIVAHGKLVRPGSVVLGLAAVGLLAVGMRRLSDSILDAETGPACPLQQT